jgi:signal transduction histidine kinase
MNRPWIVATLFGICLTVGVAAALWLSREVWRLDERDAQARTEAEQEKRIRLALWQMDAALSPIIARESARPHFAYLPLYPPSRAYNRNYAPLPYQSVWIVSPLLTERPRFLVQHFQFDANGELTSPQAPVGNARDIAEGQQFVTSQSVVEATRRVADLARVLNREMLLEQLPLPLEDLVEDDNAPEPMAMPQAQIDHDKNAWTMKDYSLRSATNRIAQELANPRVAGRASQVAQSATRVPTDPQQRVQTRGLSDQQMEGAPQRLAPIPAAKPEQKQAIEQIKKSEPESQMELDAFAKWMMDNENGKAAAGPPAKVREGLFHALWIAKRLFVARRVMVGDQEIIQGFEIDWPSLSEWLVNHCKNLVPNATLEPAANPDSVNRWHLLASLPVRLVPGAIPTEPRSTWTPARVSIVVAWIGLALALISIGLLLRGVMVLGERRATFVSSVTHELRTPLTTFRMYAEMLAAGMIPDETVRKKYLNTLRAEAERLSHLVENVLSYARLERGRDSGRIEPTPVGPFLQRIHDRFRRRAAEAGMKVSVECRDGTGEMSLRIDPIATEQILFNLVDNACKYAASADNNEIEITVSKTKLGSTLAIAVRDHGPGLSRPSGTKLFEGFRKSAYEAAHTAPGVGLGLALSRRLARRMGGELRSVPAEGGGACLILTLPVADC